MNGGRVGVAGIVLLVACGGAGVEATTTEVPTTTTTTASTSSTTTTTTTTTTVPPSTTTTVPLPTLTQEVAAASLEEVTQRLFNAWLNGAEDEYPAIDQEIRDVVRGVLAAHGRMNEVPGWQEEFLRLGEDGVEEFTNGEYFPEGTFTRLAVVGVPGAHVTLFTGVYRIGDIWTGSSGSHSGDETTIPGTYVVLDVEDCYWERLDSAGEIIDNNFINAAPRVEATIRSSDFAFNSEGCGRWVRVSD